MIQPLAIPLTMLLVALCVFVHYEALRFIHRALGSTRNHRLGVLYAMIGLLVAHVVEIWLFAFGYHAAIEWLSLGQLAPTVRDGFDLVYFSGMVYTTVGFGDLIPTGGLRMIASGEALCGLSLITWSASFTFLQMQRLWED